MPKVSINILTYNRSWLLEGALKSVLKQSFKDFEVVVVNNGSTDNTAEVLESYKNQLNLKVVSLPVSIGITAARQRALQESSAEYIAILDDDDEWVETDKLKIQAEFFDQDRDYVLAGGSIEVVLPDLKSRGVPKLSGEIKQRPQTDPAIRNSMLFRNNFFTSTVMFRKSAALRAGGFIKDADDLAEDYDLWLRMGNLGKMHNFRPVFTQYALPDYNKSRFKSFLAKQLRLINREKANYPKFWLAKLLLKIRLIF